MNDLNVKPICKKCGGNVTFKNYSNGYRDFCSIKCGSQTALVKREKTVYEKYGISNISKDNNIKNKKKNTYMKNYNVSSPLKSKEVLIKMQETNIKKYGDKCSLKNNNVRKKYLQTMLLKYGVDNPSNVDIFKEKRKQTFIKRYFVNNPMQYEPFKLKSLHNNKQVNNIVFDKLNSKSFLIKENHNLNKTISEISNDLGITSSAVLYHFNKHGIEVKINSGSKYEKEIANYIDTNIITSSKKIIPPYELDIYIPDYKLAIEFDGLYWHSNKDKNYHLNKTQMCLEKGIQLLHIFENEWIDPVKQDIWKSIINNKLNKNNKIFARKTIVKEVDNISVREFLNNNHLQGFTSSFVKLGLFYDNELISLMTFGKTRFSKKYEWEMIRFCNKKFFTVVGGASKLYRYFVNNYKPNNIISYADRRYSNGGLYEELGFEFSHYSKPNYWYFKLPDITLFNRLKFQKYKLKNLIENFNENKSEVENMINNGYKRIFDCGNIVYTKKRSLIN
jgi:very-short-patch-repair endonuclease/endogenous inhibitor of DNA gyrase (YacG/DUF329 family)